MTRSFLNVSSAEKPFLTNITQAPLSRSLSHQFFNSSIPSKSDNFLCFFSLSLLPRIEALWRRYLLFVFHFLEQSLAHYGSSVYLLSEWIFITIICKTRRNQERSGDLLLLLLFSCWVVSDSWWPHGLQHARLAFIISQSLLKLMSIESVMPSNHHTLCHLLLHCPQSFPALGSFPMSQLFASGDQNIGASASTSALPNCFFQVTCMISNMPQSLNWNFSLCYSKANAFSTLIVLLFIAFSLPLPSAVNAVLLDISCLW